MPTRIVREGIITSEQINKLSCKAELFYRRLMSVADDYGRYYAHPGLLRASCYPLKLESVSEADVKRMLNECVENGLIGTYGSGKYLQVYKFGQQTRAKSKFPEPVDNELLIKCEAPATHSLSLDGVGVVSEFGVEGDKNSGLKPTAFVPPTPKEVEAYSMMIGWPMDGAAWCDKYIQKGWMVGKNKMKDWRAAVRNWKTNKWKPDSGDVEKTKSRWGYG